MKGNNILKAILTSTICAVAFIQTASATTISIVPTINSVYNGGIYTVVQGTEFTVQIIGDLISDAGVLEPTLGGGVDVSYNAMSLTSSTANCDSAVGISCASPIDSTVWNGELLGLNSVNSDTSGIVTVGVGASFLSPVSGTGVVLATLTFIANTTGLSTIGVSLNSALGWGFAVGVDPSAVLNFTSAQINVVPIPAAVWLLGSGLVGLISMARRKRGAVVAA